MAVIIVQGTNYRIWTKNLIVIHVIFTLSIKNVQKINIFKLFLNKIIILTKLYDIIFHLYDYWVKYIENKYNKVLLIKNQRFLQV